MQQLKAVDLWGRSVLTHALLSGHELMFEAAYGAIRDVLQDELVSLCATNRSGKSFRQAVPASEAPWIIISSWHPTRARFRHTQRAVVVVRGDPTQESKTEKRISVPKRRPFPTIMFC